MTHLFLYVLALFFLSQSAALAKWAAAPPEVIGFWRLFGVSLLILPWAYFRAGLKQQIQSHKSHVLWAFFTGFFFFLHLWTFFYAAQNTLISHTMILFATNPLFVALGSWYLHKEKPTRSTALAYALALTALVILLHQSSSLGRSSLLGDISALLSAMFFAVYILLSQKCRRVFSNSVFNVLMYSATAVFFFIVLALTTSNWTNYPMNTWGGIWGQILFSTLLGHSLISYLMKHMNVTLMTTGKLSEPVMASIVAAFIFDEKLTAQAGLAFLLTGGALFVLLAPFKHSKASSGVPLK